MASTTDRSVQPRERYIRPLRSYIIPRQNFSPKLDTFSFLSTSVLTVVCDIPRQGAGTSQSREQGIIITIKAGSRTGFIRTVRRRERVFFHYASVAPLKARGDPEIGDNVDFILHNDGNRRVASDILDPKTGLFNRTAKRELSGGLLRRLEAAPGADEKGAPPSATIGVFEFHGRDVAPGLKLYIGLGVLMIISFLSYYDADCDCVTFDVFVEMVTGRIGATNVRVRPGKRAKGFVHHLAPNK
eukprot:1377999-Amorphochlora_amoeboformis.AAC.1